MKEIATVFSRIQNNKELQNKMAEAAKNNRLADFLKEMGYEETSEEFAAPVKPQNGELSDDKLDAVAGGADGNNIGWVYGPCRKCPGTRYVMQLNYMNLIACTSCGDWVEF